MAFRTFGTHDELGWSPLDTEALEDLGLLLDVNLGGDEFGADEVYDALVRIDLGFQPSTAASGGCGAEIEESRFRLLLRGLQCLVRVCEQVDSECDHDETLHGKDETARRLASPSIIRPDPGHGPPGDNYAPMERR